jgi:hypothetical protein
MAKLLLQEQMEKRVETSAALAKMVMEKGRSFLGNIINMDESAVPLHSPRNKKSVKKWLEKGKPCFTKRSKQAK